MNTRKFSRKQEKQVSKVTRGKLQPNSGATMFRKGDVFSKSFLIECKTVVKEKESISIKKEWIEKIREEMFAMNRNHWALVFNFGGNSLQRNENFYIISERDFQELQKFFEEDE